MSTRDFRTQAPLACESILTEAGKIKPGRTASDSELRSLEKGWSVAISCITETTLPTVTNNGEPDSNMLKKLCRTGVIVPLFSLILDYPVLPVSELAVPNPHETMVNLDVSCFP